MFRMYSQVAVSGNLELHAVYAILFESSPKNIVRSLSSFTDVNYGSVVFNAYNMNVAVTIRLVYQMVVEAVHMKPS